MLIDGLTLVSGSSAAKLSVEMGVALPNDPHIGQLFFKANSGLYYFDGTDWVQIGRLDANGKLLSAELPPIAINDTFAVSSEAGMLALTAEKGDLAIRSDISRTFVLSAEPASVLGNWVELLGGAGGVTSVNGKVGAVSLKASDILELAQVALSGSYSDLADKPTIPAAYSLPAATTDILGGVKLDNSTLFVNETGHLSVNPIGKASATFFGIVKVDGTSIVSNDGVLSAQVGAANLPVATATTLGAVKQGANITIAADGTISAADASYTLPTATASVKGGVKQGTNVTIAADGTLSVTDFPFNSIANFPTTVAGLGLSDAYTKSQIDTTFSFVYTKTEVDTALAGSTTKDFSAKDVTVAGNQNIAGNLTLSGNLTVNGAQTIINATTVTTKDNLIVLNSGEVGTGVTAGSAGIQVDRGAATAYQIMFDEVDDMFKVGMVGQLETIASRNWVGTNYATAGHLHALATTGTNGLMSSADKLKLEGISANANNYSLPIATDLVLGGVKQGANITIAADGTISATASDSYTLPAASVSVLGGVKQGDNINIAADGTISATLTSWSNSPFDQAWSVYGMPTDGEVLYRLRAVRAYIIPANFAGSTAMAATQATANTVFAVQKNGVQVATVTFAASGTTGVFSAQAAISFSVGDKFSVVSQATADTTLADIDFTIAGSLA